MEAGDLLWWADGVSALFLFFVYVALPLPPRERLWPRAGERLWWILILGLNIVWNTFRFVVEGILQMGVPRGFMDLSLVYCVVWAYTLGAGWNQDSQAYKRTITLMRELRRVKCVREGESTSTSPRFGYNRSGEREVVVRQGCASALWPWLAEQQVTRYRHHLPNQQAQVPPVTLERDEAEIQWVILPTCFHRDVGVEYWRGIEKDVVRRTNDRGDIAWKVTLEEKELFADVLEPFLQPGRLSGSDNSKVDLYAAVYNVTYQSCRGHANHRFLGYQNAGGMWDANRTRLPPEILANRGRCIDDTVLGGVARRIAADAVNYVFGGTLRTSQHVTTLNRIVDAIADDIMEQTVK